MWCLHVLTREKSGFLAQLPEQEHVHAMDCERMICTDEAGWSGAVPWRETTYIYGEQQTLDSHAGGLIQAVRVWLPVS